MPMPPLTQSVATPRFVLRFSISCSSVTVMRVGAADGMAEGDGASVDIEAVAIEIQHAVAGQNLRGERLVQLNESKLVQAEVVLVREFLKRRNWTDAHGFGVDSCGRHG